MDRDTLGVIRGVAGDLAAAAERLRGLCIAVPEPPEPRSRWERILREARAAMLRRASSHENPLDGRCLEIAMALAALSALEPQIREVAEGHLNQPGGSDLLAGGLGAMLAGMAGAGAVAAAIDGLGMRDKVAWLLSVALRLAAEGCPGVAPR